MRGRERISIHTYTHLKSPIELPLSITGIKFTTIENFPIFEKPQYIYHKTRKNSTNTHSNTYTLNAKIKKILF